MKTSFAAFPLLVAALGAAVPAHAERADRDKPVNLEADRITVDDAKKQHVFDGNVTLTQGTLVIRANRIVVNQDADGFQKGVATGNPARFRQKREGSDEIVEGESERIEHDARSEKTEFFNRAWVKSGLDEVKGNYISYDALSERYVVTSASDAKGGTPAGGRVRAVIQPKQKGDARKTTGTDPVPLKSAADIKPAN
jgi:lipopolysaccharide export system protein LptA